MWNFLKEKWLTLLLSVFLGWMLWMYATQMETRPDRLEAMFLVRQPSPAYQVSVEPDLKRVMLMLQGPTGAIYEATRSDRDVRVTYEPRDVEGLDDGRSHEVLLDRSMVLNLPPDVDITQFVPASIQVTIHRIGERVLPVGLPVIVGTPKPGYEVYRKEVVRPKEVLASGPVSILDKLTEVLPEPVDVTDLSEDYRDTEHRLTREYRVDGSVGQITSHSTVEVVVGVRRQADRKTIPGVQIKIAQPETVPPAQPLDIQIQANPINLELEGPLEVLNQIKPESLQAFVSIDAGELKPGEPRPRPLIVLGLPEGVKLTESISVTVRIRPKTEPQPVTEVPKKP